MPAVWLAGPTRLKAVTKWDFPLWWSGSSPNNSGQRHVGEYWWGGLGSQAKHWCNKDFDVAKVRISWCHLLNEELKTSTDIWKTCHTFTSGQRARTKPRALPYHIFFAALGQGWWWHVCAVLTSRSHSSAKTDIWAQPALWCTTPRWPHMGTDRRTQHFLSSKPSPSFT